MDFFIITGLTKDISRIDLIGILIGHLIFGVALTKLLDWTWLKNLMSEEDKTRMLKSYTWKDLLVCLLYTSPSPRDSMTSRMPSSA